MIPSLGISQVKYVIKGDTLVGYTFDENRRIAIIFKEGEYYKATNDVNEHIIKSKDVIIGAYSKQLRQSDSLIVVQNSRLNDALLQMDKNINKVNRLSKNVKFWRLTAFISLGICVPIILLK